MRILALRTEGLVLPSIHASMVRAFQSLGADILDLPVPKSSEEFQFLKSQVRQGFGAVFTLNLGRDPNFIFHLKDLQSILRIPWVIWFVDDPEGYGFPEACDVEWTVAFCWDREIARMSPKSPRKGISLIHLPLAADPQILFPERMGSALAFPGGVFVGSTGQPNDLLDSAAKTSPGFFRDLEPLWEVYRRNLKPSPQKIAWMFLNEKTGQELEMIQADPLCRLWFHTAVYILGIRKRRELVSQVIGPGGGVFGDKDWSNLVANLYRGQLAYGEEVRKVYNRSAFVLDIRPPQARTGLTQRVFDASACGRPVVAEYSPEFEFFFDPKEELWCFDNPEEAVEMKNICLRSKKETSKKANKAYLRLLSHHTYQHRAKKVLRTLSS